jgi:hypothetical protein
LPAAALPSCDRSGFALLDLFEQLFMINAPSPPEWCFEIAAVPAFATIRSWTSAITDQSASWA